MVKNDKWIKQMCLKRKMIDPFVDDQVREGIISYGLSSYGYDIRVAGDFKVFSNVHNALVDPKNFNRDSFEEFTEVPFIIIPPNSFALARSVEYFKIPRNVLSVCLGKSTYARCGIIINVTPLEPEWEGFLTIEISNTTPLPAKIYANEGIAQLLFLEGGDCVKSYKDKKGKYQDQKGVVPPLVEPRGPIGSYTLLCERPSSSIHNTEVPRKPAI